ncbi:MAG: TadE/TadG family type IV pilus assembly protein [Pseudomonadota bacterium]
MRVLKDQRGTVLLELAFALPIMMLIIFGGVELTRFLLNAQKINRVAMSTADLVSQSRRVTEGDIMNMFTASQAVMGDSVILDHGNIIISSVTRTGDDAPQVRWQRENGSHGGASTIGNEGASANLPNDVVLDPGDGVIVVEVYFKHKPFLFDTVVGERDIYQMAFFRPRFGTLEEVESNNG